jgi:hypothetical protein
LIDEKNRGSKISCYCPFKQFFRYQVKRDPFCCVFTCSSENKPQICSALFLFVSLKFFRFVSLPQHCFALFPRLNENVADLVMFYPLDPDPDDSFSGSVNISFIFSWNNKKARKREAYFWCLSFCFIFRTNPSWCCFGTFSKTLRRWK